MSEFIEPTEQQTTEPATYNTYKPPEKIGNMKQDGFFYKPEQAKLIYLVDITGLSADYIASLRCLQGLTARNEAGVIYLQGDGTDKFWKNHTESEYGITYKRVTPSELFKKYKSYVKNFVIYDPLKEYEYPIAQTKSAFTDGIPVSKTIYNHIKNIFGDIPVFTLSDNFKNASEAAEWAAGNLLELCEDVYLGVCGVKTDMNDYLYATKTFSLKIDFENPKQNELLTKIFQKTERKPGVLLCDGDIVLPSDAAYSVINIDNFTNATFHMSFPALTKNFAQPGGADKVAADTGIYASIVIIDDNKLNSSDKFLSALSGSKTKINTPVGVSVNPLIVSASPVIAVWLNNARNTSMSYIAANGGYAAVNLEKLDEKALTNWAETNETFFKKNGIKMMFGDCGSFAEVLEPINNTLKPDGFIVTGEGCRSEVVGGTAFLNTIKFEKISDLKISDLKIKTPDNSPLFIVITVDANELHKNPGKVLNSFVENLKKANEDKGIEFLLPSDIALTFRAYDLKLIDSLGCVS